MSQDTLKPPSGTDRDPSQFGPTQTDIGWYANLLQQAETDVTQLGFNPRVTAELTSTAVDRGSLGTFVNSDVAEKGLDTQAVLRLAQQRYIAASLGLVVGGTEVQSSFQTATVDVRLPRETEVPQAPTRTADGKWLAGDGTEISVIQADAIHTGRFIAKNHPTFSQEGAFEKTFERVVTQAETGVIEVEDKMGDLGGVMSMVRQVARVLGYKVGDFVQDAGTGKYVMTVDGIRPGFDSAHTHFKM